VLLVENHADTRTTMKLYLEHHGHQVMTAGTKAEALKAEAAGGCEVLISDIGLPDGEGWELMEQGHFPKPVFAIAMSGYGSRSDYQRSSTAGFRRHMLKPFDMEVLDEALEAAEREIGGG